MDEVCYAKSNKEGQPLIPRRLELQTLRLLVVRSNQLSYGIISYNSTNLY